MYGVSRVSVCVCGGGGIEAPQHGKVGAPATGTARVKRLSGLGMHVYAEDKLQR